MYIDNLILKCKMCNYLSQNSSHMSSFHYIFIYSFIHFTKLLSYSCMPDLILSSGDRNDLSSHEDYIKQIITILLTILPSGKIEGTIGLNKGNSEKSHQTNHL